MIANPCYHVIVNLKEELATFAAEVDSYIQKELSAIEKRCVQINNSSVLSTLTTQLSAVSRDGKRVRPFLVAKTYELYSGKSYTNVLSICVAIELFHIFCLIHDDIIDQAPARHNTKTIHTVLSEHQYTNRTNAEHLGNSQAILMGDILFNTVYQLFIKASLPYTNAAELLAHFNTMVEEVCVGQIIDVDLFENSTVSTASIETKNKLKTAYYSIVRPLQLGALLAAHTEPLDQLDSVGQELGLMYQYQDDLLDITANKNTTGKTRFTDVTQGQPTFLSAYIKENRPDLYKKVASYHGKKLSTGDENILLTIFKDSGALKYADEALETHRQRALAIAANSSDSAEQEFLIELIALLYKRKK